VARTAAHGVSDMIDSWFLEHPRAAGESYLQHLRAALGFGACMIGGGIACLIHALVPALFSTRGSDTVCNLHQAMAARAVRVRGTGSLDPAGPTASG
jgi:hypothetical protein